MNRYQGKVILVTASTAGIGLAIATRMAEEGGTVIVNSRKEKNVEEAVQAIKSRGFKAHGVAGNISNPESRLKLVKYIEENFGKLDVVVLNHATSLHFGPTLETKEAAIDKTLDMNIKSSILLLKDLYPYVKKVKGNILVMSSYTGYDPGVRMGIYSLTKSALLGMVKLFAKEFHDDGVRVNGIAPGIIKTKLSEALWKGKEQEILQDMQVKRLGQPEDISNAAAFLCSSEADYITGETLAILGKPSPHL